MCICASNPGLVNSLRPPRYHQVQRVQVEWPLTSWKTVSPKRLVLTVTLYHFPGITAVKRLLNHQSVWLNECELNLLRSTEKALSISCQFDKVQPPKRVPILPCATLGINRLVVLESPLGGLCHRSRQKHSHQWHCQLPPRSSLGR